MLRIRLDELSATDRDRLRMEIAATLLRDLTLIPFIDPATDHPRVVPAIARDQQQVEAFLAAAWDDQIQYEINSGSLTDYLTDLLVRYHAVNLPGRAELRRRARPARERAPQLAAAIQRRLVAYVLDGVQGEFGTMPAPTSWNSGPRAPWEQIAAGTSRLAAALSVVRDEKAVAFAPVIAALPIVERRATNIEHHYTAPLPRPLAESTRRDISGHDRAIFMQLREQLLQAMESAAKSYGLTYTVHDPAGLLEGLRAVDRIDGSDLRLAEGILALCARVAIEGRASLDDYRQALMLYLLFHRGRFAR